MNQADQKVTHKEIKKVGNRRKARESALQMLYLCDMCNFLPEDAINSFRANYDMPQAVQSFALFLFNGVWEKKTMLDTLIIEYAKNWNLDRMASIDRNILRLAAFEIVGMPETPISVIIDEAVEIAKTFSTGDSSKFVNGILDKIKSARAKH